MALEAKEIIVNIREGLVFSIRIFYKSIRDHPFVWSFAFLLYIMYICYSSLFGFVVWCSPVVVCTALLLGTLLIYGDVNIPEKEEEEKLEGFRNAASSGNNVLSDGDFSAEACLAHKSTYRGEGPESDLAESLSPDSSLSDIIPIFDELHPLLDSDAPHLALRSAENSDVASTGSSQDQSDDGRIEEEIENLEDEDDEAQEKDDANEAVLKWTEDDQKNLIDLGTSELERNQRLENLIAKRKARKFLSFHDQENLIYLSSSNPNSSVEDLSLNFQIPSISVPGRNPFDSPLPFDEETVGLPPMPGSAPSVLQPRKNPFDVLYGQEEEISDVTELIVNRQEFLLPTQDTFFHGNGNFLLDATSSGDTRQYAHSSFLKPYFVAKNGESGDSELPDLTSFGRESSENVSSKINSAHDSDTSSSDVEHEDCKELVEPESHAKSHLSSLAMHNADHVERDNQFFEEVDQTGADQVEMEIRQGENLPDSDTGKLEVIDDRYDESDSSSSEADEKHYKMSHRSCKQSVSAVSDINRTTGRVDGSQVVDPMYDYIAPVAIKSLSSSSAFADDMLHADREGFSSSNINSAEEESARRLHDNDVSSKGRHFQSDNRGTWMAGSSLSYIDEIETKSMEESEIKEGDVIGVEPSGISEDHGHPDSPVPSKFVLPSRLSFLGGHKSSSSLVEGDSDNNEASSKPVKPLTPREVPSVYHSGKCLSNSTDLPPILEED